MGDRFAIVVLAAGLSSRMAGQNKLLLPLGSSTIVHHTVSQAVESGIGPVIVVTGHDGDAVRAALEGLAVSFVLNTDYSVGMASSLNAGLSALNSDVAGSLIMLGDMPLIQTNTLRALATAAAHYSHASAIVPIVGHVWAHPVLLRRSLFPAIAALRGDQGARRLLKDRSDVQLIPVNDHGCLLDTDTPAAYEIVRDLFARTFVKKL